MTPSPYDSSGSAGARHLLHFQERLSHDRNLFCALREGILRLCSGTFPIYKYKDSVRKMLWVRGRRRTASDQKKKLKKRTRFRDSEKREKIET